MSPADRQTFEPTKEISTRKYRRQAILPWAEEIVMGLTEVGTLTLYQLLAVLCPFPYIFENDNQGC